MDKDVAEGKSTSFESVSFTNPQEHALADFSTLHFNDSGLTLSPGFQLRENIPQNPVKSFHENGLINTASYDGIERSRDKPVDPQPGVQPFGTEASLDDLDDSYGSLFSTLPELALFSNRKRTAEESQESPPEKRQHLELSAEPPSSATESTRESPSFFDAFDSLFGNGVDLSLILPDDPLPEFEEVSPRPSTSPETSESTKEQFALNEQDITSSTSREIFSVNQRSEYVSPYPVSGGPLGYLPSAPGVHTNRVAAKPVSENEQILKLQAQVAELTRQRDHYKSSLNKFTMLDDAEKEPIQLLLKEKAALQRVSTRHKSRADRNKKEAEDWEKELHIVSSLYNNLLYEVHTRRQLPEFVALPAGYKRPPLSTAVKQRLYNVVPNFPPTFASPLPMPGSVTSGSSQPPGPPAQPKQPAVTIDLTDETEEPIGGPLTPPTEQEQQKTLEELRNKKYDWLHAGKSVSTNQTTGANPLDDDELALMMEEELARE
ncbi:hypothetical protein BDV18DRAFT_83950 [Aspergillus unguis]